MSRIRTIKPQFFTDEIIAELPPLARLLFIGLWTAADREGRLEDRTKRIKVELLPYDDADVDELLNILADRHFITRYTVDFHRYIEIRTFDKHQKPNVRESPSVIPKISTENNLRKLSESRSARVRKRANLKKIRANLKSANTEGREGVGNGREGVEREVDAKVSDRRARSLSLGFTEEYFDDLQERKCFQHLDVRNVFEKFEAYCEAEGRTLERKYFIGWLNREIPNRKEGENDDRGTSAQAIRVAASLKHDN